MTFRVETDVTAAREGYADDGRATATARHSGIWVTSVWPQLQPVRVLYVRTRVTTEQ